MFQKRVKQKKPPPGKEMVGRDGAALLDQSMSRVRRIPVQSRSRERVELIVRTARNLIGARGIDGVSMREIAQAAGVQIGSVYQYFPDKGALLLTILQEHYDRTHEAIRSWLEPVKTAAELRAAGEQALDQLFEFFQNDQALRNLWAGAQAMPALVAEDNRDSYRNAELITQTVLRCLPGLRKSDIKPFALYFSHATGAIIRFVQQIDDSDGKALLRESSEIWRVRLNALEQLSKARRRS